MSNVGPTCNSEEPPLAEDDNDEVDEQMIEWVACDSFAEWHHIACVERFKVDLYLLQIISIL